MLHGTFLLHEATNAHPDPLVQLLEQALDVCPPVVIPEAAENWIEQANDFLHIPALLASGGKANLKFP